MTLIGLIYTDKIPPLPPPTPTPPRRGKKGGDVVCPFKKGWANSATARVAPTNGWGDVYGEIYIRRNNG